jgi:hypothetical protein
LAVVLTAPAALAQGLEGDGCSATVNGRTLDTLDIKHPLIIEKGDTVALTGAIPPGADDGPSQTRIYVEVVGDVPVADEPGDGSFWGGTVEIPEVLTSLAPGVYRVKGTATGPDWTCSGSAYIKIEGGPLTAAAAIGAVAAGAGGVGLLTASKPKSGQVFHEGSAATGGSGTPETSTRAAADVITLGLFGLLVALIGFIGPSWVV